MIRLLNAALRFFSNESNLVQIEEPICVVGDIHGQYVDMLNMLNKAGEPSTLNYLFLGDYVDRGLYGIEVCLLLFALKINHPRTVMMLRGNHETRNMTETFTFRGEVLKRYDVEIYDLFMEVFDNMPVSCNISNKYLAMHGGISPSLQELDQINEIDRRQEVPLNGMLCDLLWADPMDDQEAVNGVFKDNPERDCSNYFGKKPVKSLMRKHRLLSIFRGHQVKQEGFYMHRWGAKESFPYVITIFSAPNYCGSYKNKASVLILKGGSLQLKQYSDTQPRYQLPEGLDLFSWSLPFLAEKVTSMLYQLLRQCSPAELEDETMNAEIPEELRAMLVQKDEEELEDQQKKLKRRLVLKSKIQSVGRMNLMLTNMRKNQEVLVKLRQLSPDGKLPKGALLEAQPTIEFASRQYDIIKGLDA